MKLHFMPNSFFASCIMSAEPQTTIGEYFKPISEREKTANFLGKKSCLHNSQEQVSHDESRTVIFFVLFQNLRNCSKKRGIRSYLQIRLYIFKLVFKGSKEEWVLTHQMI